MKMLVSRKNLPFIHFVAGIRTASINVFEAVTKSAMGCEVALANVGLEPFAESSVEGGVFGFGDQTSFFDKVGVGAEGDVLHGKQCTLPIAHCPVHTSLGNLDSREAKALSSVGDWGSGARA